jgi:hypothetical protein
VLGSEHWNHLQLRLGRASLINHGASPESWPIFVDEQQERSSSAAHKTPPAPHAVLARHDLEGHRAGDDPLRMALLQADRNGRPPSAGS